MHPAIDTCLRASTVVADTPALADWLPTWQRCLAAGGPPIVLALRGGFAADRLAWAFAAGYQAALRTMLPGVGPHELLSLCLTETTGKRPRELRCTATQQADGRWLLEGHKSWAAFGTACTTMLVIARTVDAADAAGAPARGAAGAAPDPTPPPRLLVLRVPHDAPGVHLDGMPATGLIPELPHGRLDLQQVLLPADACLPGDGYSDFAKPFASLEDLNVGAAVLAYLLREARARSWPAALRERLVATLALLVSLTEEPLASATTQLALAGALDWARQAHAEAAALFAAIPDDPAAQRWQRDARLLGVLGAGRAQRAARAWEQLADRAREQLAGPT